MRVYETERRKRMRTVEINYDLSPLGDWTQASVKFPIPTAPHRGPEVTMDSGSAALLLYAYINLMFVWQIREIWERKSVFKIPLFIYSMCCLCACIYASVLRTFPNSLQYGWVPFKQHQHYFSPQTADSFKTQTLAHSSFKPSVSNFNSFSSGTVVSSHSSNEIILPV